MLSQLAYYSSRSNAWLHYGSTTVTGSLWITSSSSQGPWLRSIDHSSVIARSETYCLHPFSPDQGWRLATLPQLHAALDRVYKLSVGLPRLAAPPVPGQDCRLASNNGDRAAGSPTQGQDVFRNALMDYWGGRCLLTGITEPALLRASHIVPWAAEFSALALTPRSARNSRPRRESARGPGAGAPDDCLSESGGCN
jgi:HNH endonuclease